MFIKRQTGLHKHRKRAEEKAPPDLWLILQTIKLIQKILQQVRTPFSSVVSPFSVYFVSLFKINCQQQ